MRDFKVIYHPPNCTHQNIHAHCITHPANANRPSSRRVRLTHSRQRHDMVTHSFFPLPTPSSPGRHQPHSHLFHHRNAVIIGPADTPFEDGTFRLVMHFEEQYPNKPPGVKFISQMFHPNVYGTGELCLDILQNRWSPTYDVAAVLTSIQRSADHPRSLMLSAGPLTESDCVVYSTTRIPPRPRMLKPRICTRITDANTPNGSRKRWRRAGMIERRYMRGRWTGVNRLERRSARKTCAAERDAGVSANCFVFG